MLKKICSLENLRYYLALDARARRSKGLRILFNPIVRFQIALRLYEFSINTHKRIFKIIIKLYFSRLSVRLGFSIPPNVFGPGLCVVHYGTIVVNPKAKIGRNCRIHVGVNIGGKAGFYSEEDAASLCPKIGSNCYIGPGAKIFGPVKIGNYCSVGANAVVTKSFPKNRLVLIGIPAKEMIQC